MKVEKEMARVGGGGEWSNYQGRGRWGCSWTYKRTTIFLCSINIIVALYVLRSLYGSIYVYNNDSKIVIKYTPYQFSKMEESIKIRRAYKPVRLIQLVKVLKNELSREEFESELSMATKQMITDEILERLKRLNSSVKAHQQREAVESWRKEKIYSLRTRFSNSTNSPEEAGLLEKALESKWEVLKEEIGLWIPDVVDNQEHDEKPEGEEDIDDDPLPGKPVPLECNAEIHTDYGGAAVRWGLTHHKESAADCCQACLNQAKKAKPDQKKCNIWVYCPAESGCYSPDIYEHKLNECWLKYAEEPKLNFKDNYSESYRSSHPRAPLIVPWVSGVITA